MSRHRAAPDPGAAGSRDALQACGLDPEWLHDLLDRLVTEDLGERADDLTGRAVVPEDLRGRGELYARQDGVACGLLLVDPLLDVVAGRTGLPRAEARVRVRDGDRVRAGAVLADLVGPLRTLQASGGVLLNLVRHLSGVATLAARWADAVEGTGAGLVDTRDTTPGLRPLERYAVRCGGVGNGRRGLHDAVHVTAAHVAAAGSVSLALAGVRDRMPRVPVQVDVRTPVEAVEAVMAGARFLVCDRMSPDRVTGTVRRVREATAERVRVAAPAGCDPFEAKEYAQSGADHLYADRLVRDATAMAVDLTVA